MSEVVLRSGTYESRCFEEVLWKSCWARNGVLDLGGLTLITSTTALTVVNVIRKGSQSYLNSYWQYIE